MTLAEMKSDVRRRLNESGTEFFSDDDIADSLQEGLDEVADLTEYFEREATLGLLTGRTYYDLTSLLPDTFLSPRRAWSVNGNWWLRPTSPRDLDEHTYVQWELTYGEPRDYFLRGNWWLGTWPRSSSDTNGLLRFVYTSIPAALTGTETPAFPVEFHQAPVEFAMFDLMAQQRETAKALLYWASFLALVARLKEHVDKRQRIARRDVL